jgi:integral membrane sensor domain MASE1
MIILIIYFHIRLSDIFLTSFFHQLYPVWFPQAISRT